MVQGRDAACTATPAPGYILDSGRAVVIAVNKWDATDDYQRQQLKRSIESRLSFLKYAPVLEISAIRRQGLTAVWKALLQARAIENQAYVVGCNRVGEGGGPAAGGRPQLQPAPPRNASQFFPTRRPLRKIDARKFAHARRSGGEAVPCSLFLVPCWGWRCGGW